MACLPTVEAVFTAQDAYLGHSFFGFILTCLYSFFKH
jgi:hypothetical protein